MWNISQLSVSCDWTVSKHDVFFRVKLKNEKIEKESKQMRLTLFCGSIAREITGSGTNIDSWNNITHRFTISVPLLILPILGSCCEETGKFQVYLCFESSGNSAQIADNNNKVLHKLFKQLYYYTFPNQVKYYLTTKKIFCKCSMAFTGRQIHYGLLLKWHY